jgi:hypothetical protein
MSRFVALAKFILSNPWIVLHAGCTLLFAWQLASLSAGVIWPTHTVTSTVNRNLSDIDFPVLFKICIKPGFNDTALREVGYNNSFDYFLGISKYNRSLLGWAGHTPQGTAFSNVTGRSLNLLKQP